MFVDSDDELTKDAVRRMVDIANKYNSDYVDSYQIIKYTKNNKEYMFTEFKLPKNAKNKDVIYSSTNSNIVSISDDGVVTAMQVGTAYVQAMSLEDNAVKAYIKVTVK